MLRLLTVLSACVAVAACPGAGSHAASAELTIGSHQDSAALLRAIGIDLRSEALHQVIDRFVCPVGDTTCVQFQGWGYRWSAHDEPLLAALAAAAGAPVGNPPTEGVLCPFRSAASDAGYLIVLSRPIVRGDSATVTVRFMCVQEIRGTMRSFERDLEYALQRAGSTWRVVAKPLTRIT